MLQTYSNIQVVRVNVERATITIPMRSKVVTMDIWNIGGVGEADEPHLECIIRLA